MDFYAGRRVIAFGFDVLGPKFWKNVTQNRPGFAMRGTSVEEPCLGTPGRGGQQVLSIASD